MSLKNIIRKYLNFFCKDYLHHLLEAWSRPLISPRGVSRGPDRRRFLGERSHCSRSPRTFPGCCRGSDEESAPAQIRPGSEYTYPFSYWIIYHGLSLEFSKNLVFFTITQVSLNWTSFLRSDGYQFNSLYTPMDWSPRENMGLGCKKNFASWPMFQWSLFKVSKSFDKSCFPPVSFYSASKVRQRENYLSNLLHY